jgi:hypothetical protein
MRELIIVGVCLLFSLTVVAQEEVIPLYPGAAPGSESWTRQETELRTNAWGTRIVFNVAKPTLTVFRADPAKANGTAVVICPGGGFLALSIDSEGFDAARWLAARGITCFVLKYRLIESHTGDPTQELMTILPKLQELAGPVIKMALADGFGGGRLCAPARAAVRSAPESRRYHGIFGRWNCDGVGGL